MSKSLEDELIETYTRRVEKGGIIAPVVGIGLGIAIALFATCGKAGAESIANTNDKSPSYKIVISIDPIQAATRPSVIAST